MDIMGPTQARIYVSHGILLLQFRIHGKDNVLGCVIRLIHLDICIIGLILKEIQLIRERKSKMGASWNFGLDSLTSMTSMIPMMKML